MPRRAAPACGHCRRGRRHCLCTACNPTLGTTHRCASTGTDAADVQRLAAADSSLAARLDQRLPYTGAQVVYAVRTEMARTVSKTSSRAARARCFSTPMRRAPRATRPR